MRELLTGLLLASCLLPVGAFGLTIASGLSEPDLQPALVNLQSDALWTSDVRRVDTSQQSYERLPAVMATDTMVAEARLPQRQILTVAGSSKHEPPVEQNTTSNVNAQLQAELAHEWCGARYRSYDPSDNTYQPFGGGSRRVCIAPTETTTTSIEQVTAEGFPGANSADVRWCMERYSSYRVEDNTYQPYSGSRKQCVGPGSQSAKNSVETADNRSVVQF